MTSSAVDDTSIPAAIARVTATAAVAASIAARVAAIAWAATVARVAAAVATTIARVASVACVAFVAIVVAGRGAALHCVGNLERLLDSGTLAAHVIHGFQDEILWALCRLAGRHIHFDAMTITVGVDLGQVVFWVLLDINGIYNGG